MKDYKNCLEANQFENQRNHWQNNNLDVVSLKENHQELIKNYTNIKITGKSLKRETQCIHWKS